MSCSTLIEKAFDKGTEIIVDAFSEDGNPDSKLVLVTITFPTIVINIEKPEKPGILSSIWNEITAKESYYTKKWNISHPPYTIYFTQNEKYIFVTGILDPSIIKTKDLLKKIKIWHGSFGFTIDKALFKDKYIHKNFTIVDTKEDNVQIQWIDTGENIEITIQKEDIEIAL